MLIFSINPIKLQNPVRKIEAFLAKDSTLKDTAQRAVSHYARAICFMKHKDVFNVQAMDFDAFSKSLGLTVPPKIRFLNRMKKNGNWGDGSGQPPELGGPKINKKTYFDNDNQKLDKSDPEDDDVDGVKFSKSSSQKFDLSDSDNDEDFLQSKRRNHDIEMPANIGNLNPLESSRKKKVVSKAAAVKKLLKKKIVPNKKIVFDEEGEVIEQGKEKRSELAKQYENEDEGGIGKSFHLLNFTWCYFLN